MTNGMRTATISLARPLRIQALFLRRVEQILLPLLHVQCHRRCYLQPQWSVSCRIKVDSKFLLPRHNLLVSPTARFLKFLFSPRSRIEFIWYLNGVDIWYLHGVNMGRFCCNGRCPVNNDVASRSTGGV